MVVVASLVKRIDLCADATDRLVVAVRRPALNFGMRKVRIVLGEMLSAFYQQGGNPAWIIAVDRPWHTNKSGYLLFLDGRPDLYGR